MTILSANHWSTNADLILDVVSLGYIQYNDNVIDLTFGRGKWWAKYKPRFLTALTDRSEDYTNEFTDGEFNVIHDTDYTNLVGFEDNTYDVTAYDPPYICMGGRDTSTMPDFADRYGLVHAPRTPRGVHEYNVRGLREAVRITKPEGILLVKCAPYIYSGRRQEGDVWMRNDAVQMGLEVEEMFIHIGKLRAQPSGRRQLHARNNYSVLYVFRKGKNPAKNGIL